MLASRLCAFFYKPAPYALSRCLSSSSASSAPISSAPASSASARPHHILALLFPGGKYGHSNPRILGCVENALGLRSFLSSNPHLASAATLTVTSSREEFDATLPDATIAISQPFYPAYLTAPRLERAKRLQLCITAGVGSDHVDLQAAVQRRLTVAEVTGSNVVSVAEHVVLMILAVLRNYIDGYQQVVQKQWDVARVVDRAYDCQGKAVGTLGCGRIGVRVLQRLQPFDCQLHYYDKASKGKHTIRRARAVTACGASTAASALTLRSHVVSLCVRS